MEERATTTNGTGTCISLIGMAGAGKSTVGRILAERLGWACMDSDYLIEATYAARLQDVTDAFTRDEFLDIEKTVICAIKASHTVIATGGSAIYRAEAMNHLVSLGPVIYLRVPLEVIEERIRQNPLRGVVFSPGQGIPELLVEREPHYARWASHTLECDGRNPDECSRWICENLGYL